MNLDHIEKYIAIGAKDKNWFQECENTFVEIYGRDKLKLVAQLFSATSQASSQASSLKSNIQLFRKALNQWEKGVPFTGYLPGIARQLERLRASGELKGPKIKAFAAAMAGDTEAVAVDRWLLRAFGLDRLYERKTGPNKGKKLSGGPTLAQFKAIEAWVRERAEKENLEPRQLSAMIWSGVRISISGDRETHYKTILKLKLYNMYENP